MLFDYPNAFVSDFSRTGFEQPKSSQNKLPWLFLNFKEKFLKTLHFISKKKSENVEISGSVYINVKKKTFQKLYEEKKDNDYFGCGLRHSQNLQLVFCDLMKKHK